MERAAEALQRPVDEGLGADPLVTFGADITVSGQGNGQGIVDQADTDLIYSWIQGLATCN